MIDEWGNEWRRLEGITKGEVYRGVIEAGCELLETYDWPEVDRADPYEEAAARVKQYHDQGFYVQGGMGMAYDMARYMRRMEVFLSDCAAEPERVRAPSFQLHSCGGFIAGHYGADEALGLDPAYQETAARAFTANGADPWGCAAATAPAD